jgi:hypothetical protein
MFGLKIHNRPFEPVITALQGFPEGLCDNCLSAVVGKSRLAATTPARAMLGGTLAHVAYQACGRCRANRRLTVLGPPSEEVIAADPEAPSVKLRDLDSVWKKVTAYLEELDGGSSKEAFASRIETLRKSRKIAPTLSALLLTCLTYRHEVRFHAYEPSAQEDQILRNLLSFLDSHFCTPPQETILTIERQQEPTA